MFTKNKRNFIPEGFALANNRQVTNKCKYPKGPGWDSEAFNAKKCWPLFLDAFHEYLTKIRNFCIEMILKLSYMG